MKVAVFGLGYVGMTAACCIAHSGHDVIGVDVSSEKVADVKNGQSPILEPMVQDMLRASLEKGSLDAATKIGDHLDECRLAIVCVGTPSAVDGSHNMRYVAEVTRQIANAISPDRTTPLTVAYRSTIRPGTIDDLILPIFRTALSPEAFDKVRVVYNPEFLREGTAVDDYFKPPKIVVGTVDGQPDPAIDALNEGIEAPLFTTHYRESEIIKFVDNTWHAVKVAFANEIGRICLSEGISAQTVHGIFKSDTKLNISAYYTRPGGAFGGSCLPKDVRALQSISSDVGAATPLIDSLIRSNDIHKHKLFEYAARELSPGAKVLMVGLAFKAGTDDLRESPNVDLARKFLNAGFDLSILDPGVKAERLVGANLGYIYSQLPMVEGLLVDEATAHATAYDLVIFTNAAAPNQVAFQAAKSLNLHALP